MYKDFFVDLLETPTPSGYEKYGAKLFEYYCDMLPESENCYRENGSFNRAYRISDGNKKLLLSAHMDEICMAVAHITDDGFIIPANCAGVDKKVIPGHSVQILKISHKPSTDTVPGIVHKMPIHAEFYEEAEKKILDFHEMRIDIGAESREEVEKKFDVHIGDLIMSRHNIETEFGKNKIHANSLDDKAGVYVVYEVMRRLANTQTSERWRSEYEVIGLAATGEESGLLGAARAAHIINPNISIDIDVTHAVDAGILSENRYGSIKLGKGPVIEFGQDKSNRINRELRRIGEEKKIDFQEHYARCGGTNTKSFYLYSHDAETTLLSIPLLSMHTPVETVDKRDLESMIRLLFSAVMECVF